MLQYPPAVEEALNEEHKLLTMRARPKILVAESFEEAEDLYTKFEPYILGIISDVRFPRNCKLDPVAGISFLTNVKTDQLKLKSGSANVKIGYQDNQKNLISMDTFSGTRF